MIRELQIIRTEKIRFLLSEIDQSLKILDG